MLSPAFAISFDALSYALSILPIPRAFNKGRLQAPGQKFPLRHRFGDIRTGLSFLVRQPLERTMTVLGFGNCVTSRAVLGLGVLFTAGTVGSLCTSFSLPLLVKRIPIGLITLVSVCLTPLLAVGLGITSSFMLALLLYGRWNACYSGRQSS